MEKADITFTIKAEITDKQWDDLKVGDLVSFVSGKNEGLARIVAKTETRHFPDLEIVRSFSLVWY